MTSIHCRDGAVQKQVFYCRDKNHLSSEKNECQRSTRRTEIRVERIRWPGGSSPKEERVTEDVDGGDV